jgi:hypothetical protein
MLTVEEIKYFLHVNLKEAALDVEFDGLVSLLNQAEEVVEHARKKAFQVLIVEVGTLYHQLIMVSQLSF